MNWIKRLYQMCRIRFGTLSLDDLECLCAIYLEYRNPQKGTSWSSINLHNWQKVTKSESEDFLRLYLQHHTADEGLLKSKWLLKQEQIRSEYLHGLCSRKIAPTSDEEYWIIKSGEAEAVRYLRYPLSVESELELLSGTDVKMMASYVVCHVLSDKAEELLADLASGRGQQENVADYRKVLTKYFEVQKGIYGHLLYTSPEAQWALFADADNERFAYEVIEQCDMDERVLDSAVIKRMVWGLPERYMVHYLSQSYIADKPLIAELMRHGVVSGHMMDMLIISQMRLSVYKYVCGTCYERLADWNSEEREAYVSFSRQGNMAELLDFVTPRLNGGSLSPAMSAWLAARFPELSQRVILGMTEFMHNLWGRCSIFYALNPYALGKYPN